MLQKNEWLYIMYGSTNSVIFILCLLHLHFVCNMKIDLFLFYCFRHLNTPFYQQQRLLCANIEKH